MNYLHLYIYLFVCLLAYLLMYCISQVKPVNECYPNWLLGFECNVTTLFNCKQSIAERILAI